MEGGKKRSNFKQPAVLLGRVEDHPHIHTLSRIEGKKKKKKKRKRKRKRKEKTQINPNKEAPTVPKGNRDRPSFVFFAFSFLFDAF